MHWSDAVGSTDHLLWLRIAIDAGIICLASHWYNSIQTYTNVIDILPDLSLVSLFMLVLAVMLWGAPITAMAEDCH